MLKKPNPDKMTVNYAHRRGSIVVTTYGRGGEICKVLARPGQIAYDTSKKDIYILKEEEYILFNELWIGGDIWLVAQQNSKPIQGFLVNVMHIRSSMPYEKLLFRHKEIFSPYNNYKHPDIVLGEKVIFRLSAKKPKVLIITEITGEKIVGLSNGEKTTRNAIYLVYRKPNKYENKLRPYFKR